MDRIIAYSKYSKSAKALAKALNIKRHTTDTGSDKDVVICWGHIQAPIGKHRIVLNTPSKTAVANNKRIFLESLQDLSPSVRPRLPEFTTDPSKAIEWSESGLVYGRRLLTGRSGRGIIFLDEDLVEFLSCKLWTKQVKNSGEFRVHVFGNSVIDVQRKALPQGTPWSSVENRVRSHSNGFIFIRQGLTVPEDVKVQALKAVQGIGLDFGACDVVWNEHYQQATVLEVNTAPGLEGQTLESYIEEFKKILVPVTGS